MNGAGRAVVVTGASTGIGADAARRLAARGYTVFAGIRDDAAAAALVASEPRLRPLRLDVTLPDEIAAAATCVAAAGLPLHAVVGNAGIAVGGPLEGLPLGQVRQLFEVNVFGALAVAQAFLPQVRAARGRLVFVGSIAGRVTVPLLGPYSASKHALRALTDALRMELLPDGIPVVLIEPGSVKTPIWDKAEGSRERLYAALPPEILERYRSRLDRFFAVLADQARVGLPVETVGEAIASAVDAPQPAPNRILGFPARAGSVVALLPVALRDRILGR